MRARAGALLPALVLLRSLAPAQAWSQGHLFISAAALQLLPPDYPFVAIKTDDAGKSDDDEMLSPLNNSGP
eukprot:SAG31_NODE_3866_length_3801_cov_2.237979_1_plen_71_part_00